MKKLLILILVPLLYSCQYPISPNPGKDKSITLNKNFDWLLGNWKRINEEAGKKTFENWIKKSDSEYLGFGFVLQNKDTIFQENIKLLKENGCWSFSVIQKGESASTSFELVTIEKDKFTCRNELNEFPKKIMYHKNGKNLNAVISGGGMEIAFEFEKINLPYE